MARGKTHLSPKRRWRQKGLLTALGLVFAVSAVLRLGTLEFAVAETPADAADRIAPIASAQGVSAAPLIDALADVEALRDSLATREADLLDRERAVAAAQVLIEDRLAELEAMEQRLAELVAHSDRAAEADLDRLTRVYETMPPDQAARLFEQMPPSFAAGFMGRMAPATSAALMAELAPDAAYAISVVIATRNAAAPVLPGEPDPEDTEN